LPFRLDRRASILDVRLECQDLERHSMMNRFAKFHSRAQTDGTENSSTSETAPRRSFPQRHVTAHALPGNLPEGVICLSLWIIYLLIQFLLAIVINGSSSPALEINLFARKCEYSNKRQGNGNCILHTVIKLRKSWRGGLPLVSGAGLAPFSLWAQVQVSIVYFESLKETCELTVPGFERRGGLIAYLQFLLEKIMTTPWVVTERIASALKWCLAFAVIFTWC